MRSTISYGPRRPREGSVLGNLGTCFLVGGAWLSLAASLTLTNPFSLVHAQSASATLHIFVSDPSAAIVPNARVTMESPTLGIERRGVTGERGNAVFYAMPPGTYRITVSKEGFERAVLEGVELNPGLKTVLNATLAPGTPAEEVVVVAAASLLRPSDGTLGEVLDNRVITQMPLNGRHFLDLALLAPGSLPPAQGSQLSTLNNSGINVSGARETSNNFLLDGLDNNDLFVNRFVVSPSLDSVDQFTILTHNYDAEYGRSGGAQINVVVKSARNKWDGTAYGYFRHSGLDARNFFDATGEVPHLRRSQFGGSVGGPIGASEQTFLFGAIERLSERRGITQNATVPTTQERHGDFSASGRTVMDPFTGAPFTDNVIPDERIDPAGRAVVGLYPDPVISSGTVNFSASPLAELNNTQLTIRLDRRQSDRWNLFARYAMADESSASPFAPEASTLPGFGTNVADRGHNLAGGITTIVSPTVVNDLRIGYNWLSRDALSQNSGVDAFERLGMTAVDLPPLDQGFPAFTVTGYEPLGDDPSLPVVRETSLVHFSEVFSLNLFDHHLKMGGEFRRFADDGFARLMPRGRIVFTGAFTGNGLGDLLLGLPTYSMLGTHDNLQSLRNRSLNAFLQDDWRVTNSLNIGLGLRYEYNSPAIDTRQPLLVFDAAQAAAGSASPYSTLQPDRNNFAPRLGLSWDVAGKNNVVLRAGYGIFHDQTTLIETSSLYFNPPHFHLDFFSTGPTLLRLEDSFPRDQGFELESSLFTIDPHVRTAYTQHWNLDIGLRVVPEVLVEARYVGTKGTRFIRKRNLNQPPPAEGPIDERRPISGYGDILQVESGASSTYHALELQVQKRYSRGSSLTASYTFSKSIDDASSFLESDGYNETPQDSHNLSAEKALSTFDMRHRFVVAFIYEVPAMLDSAFLSDWTISSIASIQSGRPFTPRLEEDNSNTSNSGGVFGYDRPNLVGDPAVPDPMPGQFFNPEAFQIADPYHFGSAGRNILVGPGFANIDLALSKAFHLSERAGLQFRVEAFNLLNHSNFRLPEGWVNRSTFGQILSAYPAREIQVAVRLDF